jgi:hypothetical protein
LVNIQNVMIRAQLDLRRRRLTPPCNTCNAALSTCIGFLLPRIVAEQSRIPQAVRRR